MAFNKKGLFQLDKLAIIFILAFLLLGGIILFFVYVLAVPVMTNTVSTITGEFNNVAPGTDDDSRNLSQAINITTQGIPGFLEAFSWIGYVFLFMIFFTFLIVAFFAKSHPIFIGIWVGFIMLLGFTSIFLSNAYEDVKSGDAELRSYYEASLMQDMIMMFLPHIIFSFGFFGGIILFGLSKLNPEEELVY